MKYGKNRNRSTFNYFSNENENAQIFLGLQEVKKPFKIYNAF